MAISAGLVSRPAFQEISHNILNRGKAENMTEPSVNANWSITPSTSILERARLGDQEAFQRIAAMYVGLVYHWCRSAGLSKEDSEDVGQLVFLSISKNLSKFRRENPNDSFRAWMRVITRSKICDHFRSINGKIAKQKDDDFWNSRAVEDSANLSDTGCSSETSILYQSAVKLLESEFSSRDIRVFQMIVFDGLDPSDVATQLGMTINSVYITKSRIKKRLLDAFGDLIDEK